MKYVTIEGEDLQKIKNKLVSNYGDDIYILNVKTEEKGFIKKKKNYVVSVGIPDEVYLRKSKTVPKPVNQNKNQTTHITNNSIHENAKKIIEQKKHVVQANLPQKKDEEVIPETEQDEKIMLRTGEQSFLQDKLLEFEKKLDLLLTEKPSNTESLIDKYLDSLENLDFSREYLKFMKDKFKKELSFEESQNIEIIRSKVNQEIENNIDAENSQLEKGDVVILVGPTGVGKTTTLVKIASQCRIYSEMVIKFLTIDQYKIGAVDHLSNYADILKSNCVVVRTKEDFMQEVIDDVDVVFVDTLGTSQKDNQHLAVIKDKIDIKKKRIKIYLTISATTKYTDIIDIMERFRFLNYNSVIITKLDETNTLGSVVSALWKYKLPVSFLTNGQEVLDTLIVPDKKKIMEILFQGEKIYD